jgi:hypothetical protein
MNKTFTSALSMVQHIADNYARAAGQVWNAETVNVEYAAHPGARAKDCYNNAYRYMLHDGQDGMKYVLGFVLVHDIPVEHAWIRKGDRYIDPTLQGAEYIKVVEFDEAVILKFVVKHHHAPTLYDATKF